MEKGEVDTASSDFALFVLFVAFALNLLRSLIIGFLYLFYAL